MRLTTRVEGLRELEQGFEELEKLATRKAVGRRALKKAGDPLAEDMNRRAPDDPATEGGLHESYAASTRLNKAQAKLARREGRDDVFMYVGTNDPAGVQQEFGNVHSPAQPHARPAWDAGKRRTLAIIVRELGNELDKAVQRARRKAARLTR